MPPLHLIAAGDPYDAIRIISHRSLRTLPGWTEFELDPVGLPDERTRVVGEAIGDIKKKLRATPRARKSCLTVTASSTPTVPLSCYGNARTVRSICWSSSEVTLSSKPCDGCGS